MATLFALVYPNEAQAEGAFENAKGLEEAGYMKILEQALVTKDESGEIKVHDEKHPVLKGATVGAVIGGLAGAIFLVPVAGIAIGAAVGGMIGRHQESGAVQDFKSFQQSVSDELKPGGAALLLLAQTDAQDRVINDLGRHGGTLISHDLTDKQISEVQKEIDKLSGQKG